PVIGALARMFHTGLRTAALHFPATFLTLREMLIAFRIGTIDHSGSRGAAIQASRNYGRIDRIDIDRQAVIKHIAFAFEILSSGLFPVLDNAPMQLIYVLEPLFQ